MSIFHEIPLLFRRKVMETVRQPVWLISSLMTPLLYLALFSPLLKPVLGENGVLEVFIPGLLALMAFSAGTGAGWTAVWELKSGVIERFIVTPASRLALLMSAALKDAATFLITAVLVLFAAFLFGFTIHWAGLSILLLLLSLLTIATSSVSTGLGLKIKDIGGLASVVTSVQLPLTLLSGVLLPLSLGPGWIQGIAHFNPLYYAVEAARLLAGGDYWDPMVLKAFLVMIPVAALSVWWALRVYRDAGA